MKKRRCGLNSCSSSSSSEFGSFILLASVDKYSPTTRKSSREHSLIMLSSVSGSESESVSGDWPWIMHDDDQVDYVGGDDQVFKVEVDNHHLGGGGGGEGSSNEEQQQLVLKLKYLGAPSVYESCYFFKQIIGSCKGLLCLYDKIPEQVSLWNPATRQHRILPKPKHIGDDWTDLLLAFGFDLETKDYKVVLINRFESMNYREVSPIECICRVQVYSLSTDSWKLVKGITCLPGDPFLYQMEGTQYLNGSCFFIAKFFHTKQQPCFPESNRFIISFDLAKEIITPIQLPDHHHDQKLYLSCLGDELALFTKSYHNGNCEKFNVWVLKENGLSSSNSCSSVNKDSWKKLYSFQIKLKIPGEWNTPIGISNDGEFALLKTNDSEAEFGKKIKLYHFASNKVKKNFLSCSQALYKANAYKPSLASIIGGKTAAATATATKEAEAEAAAAAGGKGSSSSRTRIRSR